MSRTGDSPPDLPQLLHSIGDGSKRLHLLGSQLSERIKAFQDWLNDLPGKVEATLWVPDKGEDPELQAETGFRFHRDGKKWIISVGHYVGAVDQMTGTWQPLAEASLEMKVLAVNHFHDLLATISESQEKMAKRLERAHSRFDSFAKAIGMPKKEGE